MLTADEARALSKKSVEASLDLLDNVVRRTANEGGSEVEFTFNDISSSNIELIRQALVDLGYGSEITNNGTSIFIAWCD